MFGKFNLAHSGQHSNQCACVWSDEKEKKERKMEDSFASAMKQCCTIAQQHIVCLSLIGRLLRQYCGAVVRTEKKKKKKKEKQKLLLFRQFSRRRCVFGVRRT